MQTGRLFTVYGGVLLALDVTVGIFELFLGFVEDLLCGLGMIFTDLGADTRLNNFLFEEGLLGGGFLKSFMNNLEAKFGHFWIFLSLFN